MSRERVVLEQAAEWFALLRDENAGDAAQRRWRDWLEADPEHARAWQRVERVGEPFQRAAGVSVATSETLAKARAAGRRRALGLLGLGGVAVGGGLLVARALPWLEAERSHDLARADWRTGVGERRQLKLPDGSALAINTASAVDIDFTHGLRRVLLRAGEIFVESMPDVQLPARSLVVDTRHGRLTALGTRFAVRSDARTSHVAVFDGAVRIALTARAELAVPPVDVAAGRQARFSADGIEAVERADPWRESWSRGQFVADDASLADVVAELRRYTARPIGFDAAAARVRVVGVYPIAAPARDVPAILATLGQALPVQVRATPDGGWFIAAR